jgi:hypothetical protein
LRCLNVNTENRPRLKMNIRFLLLLALLQLTIYSCFAQGNGFPFGAVSSKELAMTNYAGDSLATALVLDEFGEVYFNESTGNMIVEFHQKIKILKLDGVRYGNFTFTLRKNENDFEKLIAVEGATHVLSSGTIKRFDLDKKSVFREENRNYTKVSFTLPNVTVGAIVEVKYIFSSPFILVLYPWEFQADTPKLRSEFRALIPANYVYNASLRGYLKLSTNETKVIRDCFSIGGAKADCSLLRFEMKDIPAFREEEFMTAKSNFLSQINFELSEIRYFDGRHDKVTKEWKDVEQELFEHQDFGNQIKKARNILDDKVKEITNGTDDPLQKAKLIFNWVKRHYTWNEYDGKYADKGVKFALENSKGNVGDINLSLLGALQLAKLDANPVILSTRSNGLPNSLYPVLSEFNYVIVQLQIGEQVYLLDATEPLAGFGLLPERCLNGTGRLLAKKDSREVQLISKAKEKSVTSLNISLREDGTLAGTMRVISYDYKALEKRRQIQSFGKVENYSASLEREWSLQTVRNMSIEYLGEHEKPLTETMEIEFNRDDLANVNRVYFNPFVVGRWTTNPFKLKERNFPVDFGTPQEETVLVVVEYPPGFTFDEMPKDVAMALPNKGGRFTFSCGNIGNKLNITYTLSLSKAIYEAQEYPYLKELFARIVQIRQTDLVLIKK